VNVVIKSNFKHLAAVPAQHNHRVTPTTLCYYYKCSHYSATITLVVEALYKVYMLKLLYIQLNADVYWRSEKQRQVSSGLNWWKRWALVSLRNVTSEENSWYYYSSTSLRCRSMCPIVTWFQLHHHMKHFLYFVSAMTASGKKSGVQRWCQRTAGWRRARKQWRAVCADQGPWTTSWQW